MRRPSRASQQILDSAIGDQSSAAHLVTQTFGGNLVHGTIFPLLFDQSVKINNAAATVFVKEGPGLAYLQSIDVYVQFYDQTKTAITFPVLYLACKAWSGASLSTAGAGGGVVLNGTGSGESVCASGDPIVEIVANFFASNVSKIPAFFSIDAAFDVFNSSAGTITPYAIVSSLFSLIRNG